MFVHLTPEEIQTIVAAMGDQPIPHGLVAAADRDSKAFIRTAFKDKRSKGAGLSFEPKAYVDRVRDGAYVMAWLWITNEEAGLPKAQDFAEFDLTDDVRDRLLARRTFRLDSLSGHDPVEASGKVECYKWTFSGNELYWEMSIDDLEPTACTPLLWVNHELLDETFSPHSDTYGDFSLSHAEAMTFIMDTIDKFFASSSKSTSDVEG